MTLHAAFRTFSRPARRTMRAGLAASTLAAALLAGAAGPAMADGLLRPNVVVDSDYVKLGDLFDNAGPKADSPVARAPAPGRRVTVDAEWLQRVANMNGLAWRPQSAFDQAVVERAGVTITHEQIESELLTALANQGAPAKAEIELANRNAQMVVGMGSAGEIGVRDLFYDRQTKRFTATVEVPANSPNASRMRVSGRVFETIEVPVLARAISHGETLSARDLTFTRVREGSLRRDIVTDADQAIGLAPRQSLRAGQMISASELQKPLAVTKGAIVTMVLKYGSMSLTAQGRAIEQGSVGDTIRIINTHSNLTVEGKVEGPNLVSVAPNGGVALAN